MPQYRLFEQTIVSIPSDGSEDLAILLSASKLLDLLLVLQTQEFQMWVVLSRGPEMPNYSSSVMCSHQWIFITDTVDAIYRPDDWYPEAILDRLAEVVGDLPAAEVWDIFFTCPLELTDIRCRTGHK